MWQKPLYDITEVCKMLGTTSRTLRFYEEKGIIQSTTVGTSSRRQYTEEQISHIKNVGGIFLKDGCSMHNPVIIISKSSLPNIRNANYAYIDTFGRYYYVNDIVAGTAETLEGNMTVDPLMSFANEIYSLK